MNWDNLRYFLELVRAGTLMGAARRLGVDYTTLSRRVLSLEKEVGNQLFERRTSGYHLTITGKRLLAHVEAIVVNLSDYEADISVTLDRPLRGRYVVSKLTDYTLRLYASPAYLQKHPAIRTRDDLAKHTFIGYVDELVFSDKLRYLEEVCAAPHVALRSTSIAAQLHAAAAGEGLAILPPFMAREYPKLHLILGSEVKITRSFWMCTHSERKDLARVKVVWDYIREVVAQEQALLLA